MNIVKYMKICAVLILLASLGGFFALQGYSRSVVKPSIPADVDSFINSIEIGSPDSYRNMKIYPIISNKSANTDFLYLDESIKNGIIDIKEKGTGDVNNLELHKNISKLPVFLMAGEIVEGAKQDRILKHDVILGLDPKTYILPVYCVEQGRWVKKSEEFKPSGVVGSNKLRSAVVQSKSQSDVWSEVSKKNRGLGASSSTSNYRASYESKAFKDDAIDFVNHYISLSKKRSDYLGVIVEIDNKVTNMDIFGDNDSFVELWPKLIKSYAQDAVDKSAVAELPTISTASSMLKKLKYSNYNEVANPGLGNEYAILSSDTAGNCLVYNNKVVHIALFADSQAEPYINDRINDVQTQQQYNQIPNLIRNRP